MKNFIQSIFIFAAWSAAAQPVVINEVYGAGGNSGALYTHDFVELFNPSFSTVDLTGWSIQYAAAGATGAWSVTILSGTIEPGRHFLVQLAGGANGQALPTPDMIGTTNLAATAGKIALVQSTIPLNGACPASAVIIDKVGYGASANCFEGSGPSPAPSATLAVRRVPDGFDSNQNATDFKTGAPQPQHSFPRSQTIAFDPLAARHYGDGPIVLVASSSAGLPVTFVSNNPSVAVANGNQLSIANSGIAQITAQQAGNAQFAAASTVQTLVVDKALLQITAPNLSRMQGDSNPAMVLTYSGFVNGEDAGVLDEVPIPNCAADAKSVPGSYPIVVNGGADNNYEFTVTEGILTVLPLPPVNNQLPFLKSPDDKNLGIGLSPRLTSSLVLGATQYTIEVSDMPDFSHRVSLTTGARSQVIAGLLPGTTYFARIKTELDPIWGPTRSFKTAPAIVLTYLREPVDQSDQASWLPRLVVNDASLSSYVIQLSTNPQFSNPLQLVANGGVVEVVSALDYRTLYFCRVRANQLPETWGPVRSFTTGHPDDFSVIRSPREGATDVPVESRFTINHVPGATTYFLRLRKIDSSEEEVLEKSLRSFVTWLSPTTRYEASVKTNLSIEWGAAVTFQTGAMPDLSFMISPANNAESVLSSPLISARQLPSAGRYTIEVNTTEDFTAKGEVKTSKSRSIRFHLQEGRRYYVRVETDIRPGVWGPTGTFTTAGGQVSSAAVVSRRIPGATDIVSEAEVPDVAVSSVFPNPFADRLNVRSRASSVRIMDMTGREIYRGGVPAGGVQIVTGDWPSGVYLVEELGLDWHGRTRVVKR